MWFTRLLLIAFVICVILVLHDIRRILEIQNELLKEQYIIRGEMNFIMDMAINPTRFVNGSGPVNHPGPEEKKDETTTVEIQI